MRYRKLAREASKWYKACKALAKELSQKGPGLLLRMLGALGKNPTTGYPGRQDYGHIRICRLFMYALGVNATDGQEDLYVYRRCSSHVAETYELYNICSYADALSARGFMRKMLGMPRYSLSDLTAYICLQGQKHGSMAPLVPRGRGWGGSRMKAQVMKAMKYAKSASHSQPTKAMKK